MIKLNNYFGILILLVMAFVGASADAAEVLTLTNKTEILYADKVNTGIDNLSSKVMV